MATDLQRFVDAQAPVYAQVVEELRRGRKTSHWMWFIFPQLRGLGQSAMAIYYGLASDAEARAYWCHELLGPRLRECTELVLAVDNQSALDILGSPDDVKLRSCMTLFEAAVPDEKLFTTLLGKLFGASAICARWLCSRRRRMRLSLNSLSPPTAKPVVKCRATCSWYQATRQTDPLIIGGATNAHSLPSALAFKGLRLRFAGLYDLPEERHFLRAVFEAW